MDDDIQLSIVIPTYQRITDLVVCIEKITESCKYVKNICYEIVISDDENSKTTQSIANLFPNVKIIRGPNKGPAANRNNGAKHTKGEWIVFTDDDCIPDRNWIREITRTIKKKRKIVGIEGAIHPLYRTNQSLDECPVNFSGANFWSANIIINKRIFDEIGGFDENYKYAAYEDMDIYYRLREKGEVPFIKEIIVYHPPRIATIYSSVKKMARICESFAYHLNKNANYLNLKSNTDKIRYYINLNFHFLLHYLKALNLKQSFLKLMYLLFGTHIFLFFLNKRTNI